MLAGQPVSKARHLIQGTSYGAVPPHWDASLMDLSLAVTDEEAKRVASDAGGAGGTVRGLFRRRQCAAVKLLQSGRLRADAVVATVLCDTGLKY